MTAPRNAPRNTTEEMKDVGNVLGFLAQSAVTGNPSAAIEAMEAQGQRELVNSDVIPTKGTSPDEFDYHHDAEGNYVKDTVSNRQKFEDLGFVFGEVVPRDEMFINVTLPPGWTRKGSGHSMWSYIHDERDIPRISIFYKAAFYDRSAHCGIDSVAGKYATSIRYGDPKYDDYIDVRTQWLPKLTDAEQAKLVSILEKEIAEPVESWHDEKDAERKQKLVDELAFIKANYANA